MNTTEKTNGSQALDGALFLAQPASDDGVANTNQDELSAPPPELEGMYRACYQAGQVSGWEAGYRLGYQAGFGDGRRQGDDGSTATAAAVENRVGNSEVGNGEAGKRGSGRCKEGHPRLPRSEFGRRVFCHYGQRSRC